jgi:membrane-associated phospholipid phosphatase
MTRPRERGFLARRLSSEEHLGLHLTIGLVVCLLLVGVFGFLAHAVVGEQALTEFDQQVGRDLEANRKDSPHVRHAMIVLTEIGSPEAMAGLTVLVALGLLMRRRRLLALVWLFAMIATAVLNLGLKSAFNRMRPDFRDPIIDERTNSFPSGHSMGAIIAFGLLTYFLLLVLSDRRERVAVVVLAAVLTVMIGFSRIYLGAHYFSDVIGGFAVGGAWLSVCISSAESARRRHKKTTEPAPQPPPD